MRHAKFLTILILLLSGSAFADWHYVGTSNDGKTDIYIDLETLSWKGTKAERIKIWDLLDFKDARTAPNNAAYHSVNAQQEFDCSKLKARYVTYSAFSGHMGQGDVVFNDPGPFKWEAVKPDSPREILMKMACAL